MLARSACAHAVRRRAGAGLAAAVRHFSSTGVALEQHTFRSDRNCLHIQRMSRDGRKTNPVNTILISFASVIFVSAWVQIFITVYEDEVAKYGV